MSQQYEIPQVMDWTILPAKVTARAWTNPSFKRNLLSNPNKALKNTLRSYAGDRTFCVVQNIGNVRHLVLPFGRKNMKDWERNYALKVVRRETGGERNLKWFLPAEVIVKAWFDPYFKK